MTESEAIEELKHSIVSYEVQNRNNITCDLTREVLNMAINALEKQIPKKRNSYSCPICSHYFEDGECFTYCPECGQRLE